MSERKINLEEIIDSQKMAIPKEYLQGAVNMGNPVGNDYQKILNAMKQACRQTLELAAENASMCGYNSSKPDNMNEMFNACMDDNSGLWYYINKKSILDTINQIE